MTTLTSLFGILVLSVPEGGAAWAYLLFASVVCGGAIVYSSRMRRRGNN
jgi:Mg2+ and Co2+ transporter CorA